MNLKANINKDVSAFVQIQDVRTWGGGDQSFPPPSITNTGTDASANALDMHQGYLEIKNFLNVFHLKAGRQEIMLDDQRLIGNIGWLQQAQSFDAARFMWSSDLFDLNLITAQLLITDTHPVLASYLGTQPEPATKPREHDANLYSIHGSFKLSSGVVNPYIHIVDNPTTIAPASDDGAVNTEFIQTSGVYTKFRVGGLAFAFNGAMQEGRVDDDIDIRAMFYTLNLDYWFSDKFSVGVWYDHYSGDEDSTDDERNNFNSLFGTNHAFLGYMDKYLLIPTNGMTDTQLRFTGKFTKKSTMMVHYHSFATPSEAEEGGENAGQELDITYKYKSTENVTYQTGFSRYFGSGEDINLATTGDSRENSNFLYGQVSLNF